MTRTLGIAIVGAAGIGLFLFASLPNLDRDIQGDLEAMASGAHVESTQVVRRADIVCFDHVSGTARWDFETESKRMGGAFSRSLQACGINGSCCNLASEAAVIGLVKDSQIQCVTIYDFDFFSRSNRAFCAPSAGLKVGHKTIAPGTIHPHRPWVTRPGRAAFEVWEEPAARP